ncbi:hypothetical protein [Streptomyces sp. KMM 9044]|uniref:hypothetical protein n=1 Tax=Streptomyces sp. KMM 9044 TaxID=2744474 RepID=UPI002150B049|nr:hypothetical protein [Streptomyces sp. KMM 9044]WAX80339.1 hypothetical protein HUV60_024450 [Streptomyces sp. KMM 9044]
MDVGPLADTAFPGLSVLVVEDAADDGDAVVVTSRTREAAVPRPVRRTCRSTATDPSMNK